jgi:diguanylate cyclase (GGDEF)-like protein
MTIDDLPDGLKRGLARFLAGFCMLMAATVGLLAWQHYGMERVVVVDGTNALRVEAGDDREVHGGSTATLQRDESTVRLHCALTRDVDWPYCRLRLFLAYEGKGIDLSQFESFSLDMRYEGPQPHQVRVYVINHEDGQSRPGELSSNRVNELDRLPIPDHGTVTVPMNVFYTAPYWKNDEHVPLERTGARYDNVFALELLNTTGADPVPYAMTLKSVRFHGKWISQAHLLMILVGLWILCAVSWPVLAAYGLRTKLHHSRVRLAVMQEMQDALRLEARELADQAHLDPLTRVLNREGLRAALAKTAPAATSPLSVIFADIDYFKRINDTHGHAVGDTVLRHFAGLLSALVRSSDKVVRWGGEEFLIVCERTTARQAALLSEELRKAMLAQAWPAGLAVSASFGVAQTASPDGIEDAIARADAQLYLAKQAGRNRVHVEDAALDSGGAVVDGAAIGHAR